MKSNQRFKRIINWYDSLNMFSSLICFSGYSFCDVQSRVKSYANLILHKHFFYYLYNETVLFIVDIFNEIYFKEFMKTKLQIEI